MAGVVGAVLIVSGMAPELTAQSRDDAERVVAQRRAAAVVARARRIGNVAPLAVQGVNIVGVAWTSEHQPVPNPFVNLRNVLSGRVVAETQGNPDGEFAFANLDNGTYLVELVDQHKHVMAVGEVVTVLAGETVATFVILSNSAPALAAFGTNMAGAAMSAAANAGVPALINGSPVSGES